MLEDPGWEREASATGGALQAPLFNLLFVANQLLDKPDFGQNFIQYGGAEHLERILTQSSFDLNYKTGCFSILVTLHTSGVRPELRIDATFTQSLIQLLSSPQYHLGVIYINNAFLQASNEGKSVETLTEFNKAGIPSYVLTQLSSVATSLASKQEDGGEILSSIADDLIKCCKLLILQNQISDFTAVFTGLLSFLSNICNVLADIFEDSSQSSLMLRLFKLVLQVMDILKLFVSFHEFEAPHFPVTEFLDCILTTIIVYIRIGCGVKSQSDSFDVKNSVTQAVEMIQLCTSRDPLFLATDFVDWFFSEGLTYLTDCLFKPEGAQLSPALKLQILLLLDCLVQESSCYASSEAAKKTVENLHPSVGASVSSYVKQALKSTGLFSEDERIVTYLSLETSVGILTKILSARPSGSDPLDLKISIKDFHEFITALPEDAKGKTTEIVTPILHIPFPTEESIALEEECQKIKAACAVEEDTTFSMLNLEFMAIAEKIPMFHEDYQILLALISELEENFGRTLIGYQEIQEITSIAAAFGRENVELLEESGRKLIVAEEKAIGEVLFGTYKFFLWEYCTRLCLQYEVEEEVERLLLTWEEDNFVTRVLLSNLRALQAIRAKLLLVAKQRDLMNEEDKGRLALTRSEEADRAMIVLEHDEAISRIRSYTSRDLEIDCFASEFLARATLLNEQMLEQQQLAFLATEDSQRVSIAAELKAVDELCLAQFHQFNSFLKLLRKEQRERLAIVNVCRGYLLMEDNMKLWNAQDTERTTILQAEDSSFRDLVRKIRQSIRNLLKKYARKPSTVEGSPSETPTAAAVAGTATPTSKEQQLPPNNSVGSIQEETSPMGNSVVSKQDGHDDNQYRYLDPINPTDNFLQALGYYFGLNSEPVPIPETAGRPSKSKFNLRESRLEHLIKKLRQEAMASPKHPLRYPGVLPPIEGSPANGVTFPLNNTGLGEGSSSSPTASTSSPSKRKAKLLSSQSPDNSSYHQNVNTPFKSKQVDVLANTGSMGVLKPDYYGSYYPRLKVPQQLQTPYMMHSRILFRFLEKGGIVSPMSSGITFSASRKAELHSAKQNISGNFEAALGQDWLRASMLRKIARRSPVASPYSQQRATK